MVLEMMVFGGSGEASRGALLAGGDVGGGSRLGLRAAGGGKHRGGSGEDGETDHRNSGWGWGVSAGSRVGDLVERLTMGIAPAR